MFKTYNIWIVSIVNRKENKDPGKKSSKFLKDYEYFISMGKFASFLQNIKYFLL